MRAILLSTDLMFGSKFTATARHTAAEARCIGSVAALLELPQAAPQPSEPIGLVAVDLSLPGLDLVALVEQLRTWQPRPRIVAYAPHVHTALLDAARAAQCDTVLTRGQFDAQLAQLLR